MKVLYLVATARRNLTGKTNGWKTILTVHYSDRTADHLR